MHHTRSVRENMLLLSSQALKRVSLMKMDDYDAPSVPSCLRALRGLLTRLIYEPRVPFSSALYVRMKIFLGQICSLAETSHLPGTIKGATNRAAFM